MINSMPYQEPIPGGQYSDDAGQATLDDNAAIRLDSAIPYYYQLLEYMTRKIHTGEWKAGQKLPSEQELCDFFGVSRTVVRQALNNLVNDNLVVTHKGRGSYVAPKKNVLKLMQSMSGFYEDAVARGQAVGTQVLALQVLPADDELAEFLEIKEGDPVIKLRRLRSINGEAVVVVNTFIPERLCPNLVNEDMSDKSLYRLLSEKYNLRIAQGIRVIESVNAAPDIAELLGIPSGAALTLLKSVGRLEDGTPLEYFISWHRGDRSRFTVQLVNMP